MTLTSSFRNERQYSTPRTQKIWRFPDRPNSKQIPAALRDVEFTKTFVQEVEASNKNYASSFKTVVNRGGKNKSTLDAYDYNHLYETGVKERDKQSAVFKDNATYRKKVPHTPLVNAFPVTTRSWRNTCSDDFASYIPRMSENLCQNDLVRKKDDKFASLPFRRDYNAGRKSFAASTGCGAQFDFEVKDTVRVRDPDKNSAVFLNPGFEAVDINAVTKNMIKTRQEAMEKEQKKKGKNNPGRVRSLTMMVDSAFEGDFRNDEKQSGFYGTQEVILRKMRRNGSVESMKVAKKGPTMLQNREESEDPLDFYAKPIDPRNLSGMEKTQDSMTNDYGVGHLLKNSASSKSFSFLFDKKSKRFQEKSKVATEKIGPGSYEVLDNIGVTEPWKMSSAFLATQRKEIPGFIDRSDEPD